MSITNKASAHWQGDLKTGQGSVSTASGSLSKTPYGFKNRFEGEPGTNPEELIGAAHASCFSMALSMILGEAGFISVIVVMDSVSGKVAGGPEIHARGFAEDDSVFEDVKPAIIDALDRAVADGATDSYQLQQTVRRVIGRWVSNTHRRRPMIIPVVIDA